MTLRKFYQNKKVFVTGHTGFKGGWLCVWLKELGADVTGYSLDAPSQPNFFETYGLANEVKSIYGDINDREALHKALEQTQPEIVFHLAAQSLVRYSYDNPVETFRTNVLGTVELLDALRKIDSVKAIVNVTTDKCYENQHLERGYREDDPMGGFDPYSSSKGCSELVTRTFERSFFNEQNLTLLASARAGNVIGGGDWGLDRLIPDCIRSFSEGKEVSIRFPQAIRPWQHVLEPLSGYLLLAQQLWEGNRNCVGGWNFGPDDAQSQTVEFVVDQIVSLWGEGARWNKDQNENPHEAALLKLDATKAKTQLGWYPQWDIETTLRKTVEWYKTFYMLKDIQQLTCNQINEYTQLIEKTNERELPVL